jgi:sugar-phosphatase
VNLECAAVLFDCDGVLVDSDASVARAWSRWAGSFGLDPGAVTAMAHGRRAADTVRMLVAPHEQEAALARINAYELEDAETVRAVPGARELTAELPADRWAVVTSATKALARARLSAAGYMRPDVLVTADDVRHGKPDPEPYLAAAADLRVDASAAVVVEDAASGIRAARAAGVGAVLGVGERALPTDADVVVGNLSGVRWLGTGLRIIPDAVLR